MYWLQITNIIKCTGLHITNMMSYTSPASCLVMAVSNTVSGTGVTDHQEDLLRWLTWCITLTYRSQPRRHTALVYRSEIRCPKVAYISSIWCLVLATDNLHDGLYIFSICRLPDCIAPTPRTPIDVSDQLIGTHQWAERLRWHRFHEMKKREESGADNALPDQEVFKKTTLE